MYEARRVGDPDEAKRLLNVAKVAFTRALEIDPSDGRGFLGAAKLFESEGAPAEARAVLEEGCRATNGENAFLWQAWAVLEQRQGNLRRARELFDAATVADKAHAAAWHGWGMLELRQGNYQRARDLLTKGLRLVPDGRPGKEFLFQSLGVMAADRGRSEEARKHFRDGVKTPLGRASGALWQAWALMEQRLGDVEEARRLFALGLQATPKNRYLWLAWAQLEAEAGAAAKARELFAAGAALNGRDAPLLQAWAVMEAGQGSLGAARALFARAARADASHQPVWQAWGVMEFRAGNADSARTLFQRGVWADPRSLDAARLFQAWAVLEERAGAVPVARALFKCAVKVNPASVPAWQSWAAMEERQGALQRAQELRQLCLQQRAEEVVGQADLSPAGLESMLRPVIDRVRSMFAVDAASPLPEAEAAASSDAVAAEAASAARAVRRQDLEISEAVSRIIDSVSGSRERAFNREQRRGGVGRPQKQKLLGRAAAADNAVAAAAYAALGASPLQAGAGEALPPDDLVMEFRQRGPTSDDEEDERE